MVSLGAELIYVLNDGSIDSQRAVLGRFTSKLQWDEEKLLIISPKLVLKLIYNT